MGLGCDWGGLQVLSLGASLGEGGRQELHTEKGDALGGGECAARTGEKCSLHGTQTTPRSHRTKNGTKLRREENNEEDKSPWGGVTTLH